MTDQPSSWPVLVGVLVVAALAINVAAWVLLVRLLAGRERLLGSRLDDLARRLARLEAAPRESPGASAPTSERTERTGSPSKARAGAPGRSDAWPSRDRERGRGGSQPTLISVPDLGHDGPPADPQAGGEMSRKHHAVWALAEAGTPAEEIARQTGQPIGEVELILGLRRRLHSPTGANPHVRSE